MNAIDGVKILISVSKAVGGTFSGMAGAAVAVVGGVKKHFDQKNNELLELTEQNEGCAHIEMIDGWSQPFNDMLSQLGSKGGIAWKNGDGNSLWYYHAEESFRPLSIREGYVSKRFQKVPHSEAGKGICSKCDSTGKKRRSA